MIRAAILAVALIASASLLWIAGEQHRENCIREGKAACSVLPWESGRSTPPAVTEPSGVPCARDVPLSVCRALQGG